MNSPVAPELTAEDMHPFGRDFFWHVEGADWELEAAETALFFELEEHGVDSLTPQECELIRGRLAHIGLMRGWLQRRLMPGAQDAPPAEPDFMEGLSDGKEGGRPC